MEEYLIDRFVQYMIAVVILRGYRRMTVFILVPSTRTPRIMNLGEQETGSSAE